MHFLEILILCDSDTTAIFFWMLQLGIAQPIQTDALPETMMIQFIVVYVRQ